MNVKEKNFISIVVYVRNQEKTVEDFLSRLDMLMKDRFEAYEFILVNDHSEDLTLDRIKKVSNEIHANVSVINLAWKHKLELAILAGVDIAIGDFIYEFESTVIDYDINIVWQVYEKALSGYDIVSVSPDKAVKLTSRLFYDYFK